MNARVSCLLAASYCRKQRCFPNAAANSLDAKRRLSLFRVCLLVFLGATQAVSAQSELSADQDINNRPYWVNVLYFRDGEGEQTLTEVLVEVPYASVAFKKAGYGYESKVEVGVIFDDDSGFQVDGNALSKLIRTHDFAATQSASHTHIFHFVFRVAPGAYRLRLVIGDEVVASRFSYACEIDIPCSTSLSP
jgi:hypothetical protein